MFHKDKTKSALPLAEVRKKLKTERIQRVLTAHQLLLSEKHQAHMAEFRQFLGLDEARFNLYCQKLVMVLASYLQEIPETRNSYFSTKGGFLNHAMNRCSAALKACRAYFISDEHSPVEKLSEQQLTWLYCLFSAALLRGIGKLLIDFNIDVFDAVGVCLGRWQPLMGPLVEQGASFYDYDFDVPHHESFKKRVTVSLAIKIMPAEGLKWLSSDKEILAVWLGLLEEDSRAAGTLGIVLDKADALVINRYFHEQALSAFSKEAEAGLGHFSSNGGPFGGGENPAHAIKEGEIPAAGLEFIKWLSKSLGTAQLMVNKAPLFAVPGGLLMSPDMFKLFVREHPQFKNWQLVQQAFLKMQLHTLGNDGNPTQRFLQEKANQQCTGIVLGAMAVVLPEKFSIINLANGTQSMTTPQGLLSQTQLSSHFKVQTNPAVTTAQYLSPAGHWTKGGAITQPSVQQPTQKGG